MNLAPPPTAPRKISQNNQEHTTTSRYFPIPAKTQAMGSQSEANLSTIGRPTQRQRSLSRPRNEMNPQLNARSRTPSRNRNEGRGRSKSTPRNRRQPSRSLSRPRNEAPPTPRTFDVTGIVVAEDAKNFFVWCRGRLPGQNITILKTSNSASLSLTSWVEFTVTNEQMSRFFLDEMPENGIYPRFQMVKFRNVPTKFPTFLNTQDNSISIAINLRIHESSEIKNISHHIFGVIINQNFTFHESGMYSIIIRNRFKNGENAKTVWYLEESELLPPYQPTPINRNRVENNLNANPPVPLTATSRYSLLQAKTQALGSQSEANLSIIGGPPQRQRSSSRPRNEVSFEKTPKMRQGARKTPRLQKCVKTS
ncbi:hypothetical protein B9Z55_008590 [Caenorhabditis nigoni]|uniref:Uncharacterized protein n=1 Tax=Caenorhabditis nigoni TaxID=1611254 RepID=A0A2G5UNG0_9PELO|nr:hypothetical protein B9Z55_008590 [Caenorhabditis nigoni]